MRLGARARDLLTGGALVLAFLACALPAGAATVVLVWTATTGAGVPGGRTIQAQPGDLLTLRMRIELAPGESLSGYFASMRWDTDLADELDLVSVQELVVTDLDYPSSPGILVPLDAGPDSTQESQANLQMGQVLTCEASTFGPGITSPGDYDLCEFVFSVTGSVNNGPANLAPGLFHVPVDGFVDAASQPFTPTFLASDVRAIQPVPALPGFGLLILALALLAAAHPPGTARGANASR